MSAIDAIAPIPIARLTVLTHAEVRPVSDEMKQQMEAMTKAQYMRPVGPADNAPQNRYATIYKNGQVVSEIDNSGGASTSNALSGVIMNDAALRDGAPGPRLAQQRAEAIAKAIGGTIVKASTAQTQAQWNARPARAFYFDEAAYAADMARTQARAPASTLMQAQLLGQSEESGTAA